MVPRGVGTMFAMMFAGRLAMSMDPRHVMAAGTALLLWSMWAMSRWTPDIAPWWLCSRDLRAGRRHGTGLCADESGGLRHPAADVPHRRLGARST